MAKTKRKKTSNIIPVIVKQKKDSLSSGVWLPLAAVLILPVLINPWGFNRFALPKMTFMQIVIAVYFFKTSFNLYKGRTVNFTIGNWLIPYAVFLILALLSAIFSIHPITAFFGQTNRYDGLTSLVSYGLFGLFIASMIKSRADLRALHWSFIIGLTAVSFYAVLQHFGIGTEQWNAPSDIGRVFSTIGNSNLLGAYIAMLLPVLLTFYLINEFTKNDFIWFAWIALPLAVAALIFSATRGAWIGAVISIISFISFAFTRKNLRAISKRIIVVATVLAILSVTILFVTKPPSTKVVTSYLHRLKTIFDSSSSSAKYRVNIWKITLKMIDDRPILGSGPDTFKEYFFSYRFPQFDKDLPADKAHSDFLQIASTTGLLGFTAFLWFMIYVFYRAMKIFRSVEDENTAVILLSYVSGLIGYLVSIQFSFSLPTVTPMFWAVIGGVTAVSAQQNEPGINYLKFNLESKNRKFIGLFMLSIAMITVFTVRSVIADRYIDAAMIYQAQGDEKTALDDFKIASKVNSTEDSYYTMTAKHLLKMTESSKSKKDIEQAISIYKKAKKINPLDEEVYFGLNTAYFTAASQFKMPVMEDAKKNIEELLEIAPESSKAKKFLADWSGNQNKTVIHNNIVSP